MAILLLDRLSASWTISFLHRVAWMSYKTNGRCVIYLIISCLVLGVRNLVSSLYLIIKRICYLALQARLSLGLVA